MRGCGVALDAVNWLAKNASNYNFRESDGDVENVLAQAKNLFQHLSNSCSTCNILDCIYSENFTTTTSSSVSLRSKIIS